VKIYNADFLELPLPLKSIDLIVTSPPYNLKINYGKYKDNFSYEAYLDFSRKWLTKCFDLLKEDGRICINLPLDTSKNGSVSADITNLAKQIGFKYKTTIIWNEGNINKKFTWGSFASASSPNVITPVEVVLVFYKNKWKKTNRGTSDITKTEFVKWSNGLWNFAGEGKRLHPAAFPVELPTRCIKLFSYVGDTVMDPFMGSGTTIFACKLLNRNGIGVEINAEYCKIVASA
jgi:site-specific DNA-methyltransferase (adenine-specific)